MGWMDGWMDGWKHVWMDEWIVARVDRWVDGCAVLGSGLLFVSEREEGVVTLHLAILGVCLGQ